MAVLAPIAIFGVLEPISVPGDAHATIENLLAREGMFRLAILFMLIVAVLDIIVAWGLHLLIAPRNSHLSLLAAWFRLAYTAVLAVAVASLVKALNLAVMAVPEANVPAALQLDAFDQTFNLGLGLFGCHLIVLGIAFLRSRLIPRWLSALVAVAGFGYLADTIGALLMPGYGLSLASYTFIGEVLLIIWLLILGFRKAR